MVDPEASSPESCRHGRKVHRSTSTHGSSMECLQFGNHAQFSDFGGSGKISGGLETRVRARRQGQESGGTHVWYYVLVFFVACACAPPSFAPTLCRVRMRLPFRRRWLRCLRANLTSSRARPRPAPAASASPPRCPGRGRPGAAGGADADVIDAPSRARRGRARLHLQRDRPGQGAASSSSASGWLRRLRPFTIAANCIANCGCRGHRTVA